MYKGYFGGFCVMSMSFLGGKYCVLLFIVVAVVPVILIVVVDLIVVCL